MMRIWQLCFAVLVAVTVLAPATVILNELRTTEADIGPGGTRTQREFIARNVIIGEAIRVCTDDLPNSTADAITEINDALLSEGVAVRFNVFRKGAECPPSVPPATDRVDYVNVIAMAESQQRCVSADAVACLKRDRLLDYNHTLQTYKDELDIFVHHDFAEKDDDNDLELSSILVHEFLHVLGVPDEYGKEFGDSYCARSPWTTNTPTVMHCLGDGPTERPLVTPYDRTNIANIYRPLR